MWIYYHNQYFKESYPKHNKLDGNGRPGKWVIQTKCNTIHDKWIIQHDIISIIKLKLFRERQFVLREHVENDLVRSKASFIFVSALYNILKFLSQELVRVKMGSETSPPIPKVTYVLLYFSHFHSPPTSIHLSPNLYEIEYIWVYKLKIVNHLHTFL